MAPPSEKWKISSDWWKGSWLGYGESGKGRRLTGSEVQEPQAAAHPQPKDSRSDLQTIQMASVSHILLPVDPVPLAAAWSRDLTLLIMSS